MVALTFVFGGGGRPRSALLRQRRGPRSDLHRGCPWDLRRTESPAHAIRLFTYSITYVTLLFGVMAADVIIRNGW